MRKHNVIVMLLLAICLWIYGCGSAAEDPADSILTHSQSMQGSDAQNQYMLSRITGFQETKDFFFGSNCMDNFIQWYDKTSGMSGTLCADPSCTHDSSDCAAYIQAGAALSFSDGMLYRIAQDMQGSKDYYLWRSELSGMNQEKIKQIGFEDIILTYQPQQYVIHRGNLYIFGRNDMVDGIQSLRRVSLLSTPLNSTEEYTTIYDETFDCNVMSEIRFAGDYGYVAAITFPKDASSFHVTVRKIDLHSGNTEIVFEEEKISESPGTFWVTEQGELYLPGIDDTHAYVWKLESNERVPIVSQEGSCPSMPYIMDEIAAFFVLRENVRFIQIRNLSGETLYDGKLFPEGIPGLQGDPNEYMFSVVGGDREKLILNLQNFAETGFVDYTIMLDVTDNLKPTILWSSQR